MIHQLRGIDGVKRTIKNLINDYIQPELRAVNLEAIDCDGHIILSIKIPPLPTETPFKVRRSLDRIETGQSWIRTGESNERLAPEMEGIYHPFTKCPYIFPEQWENYFVKLQERFKESFTIEGYQELLSNNGIEIVEEIRRFLESNKNLLVITGEAAIGKTTLLERFAYMRAELLEGDIGNQENYHQVYYPFGFIPIFVSLRELNINNSDQMESLLVNRLCEGLKFPERRPEELNRLFENRRYHFVVLLDGFDEILNRVVGRSFIRILEDLIRKYPDLKFILATRPPSPSFADEYRKDISEIRIQPFNQEQIRKYIEVQCKSEILEKVETFIYADQELTQICSIPFYLETALPEIIGEYSPQQDDLVKENEIIPTIAEDGEDMDNSENNSQPSEIAQAEELTLDQPIEVRTEATESQKTLIEDQNIRIGVMLDRIYWRAWNREAQKRNYDPDTMRSFWSQTEKLAINVNLGEEIGHHQFNRVMRRNARMFCLSLSVLTETEERRRIRFFTDLTQVIFAANYLKELIQENRTRFENQIQGLSTQFQDKLTPILMDISPKFYTLNTQEE
ncbi:NACHT domain-containing protein [Bellilinea caldifistulae]|uniref:NACHT domain-containing protein n=1 Tax=Bellilinea caldifistulae TaxID=360411 RepID=A0A0N8GKX9_9CHLR|nr:NACHT domain-containing protein [Bellilinea caldifistulae]KPL70946.1 hypothetical protein AC812_16635 [Bellilinea caldifistulae]